MAIPWWRRLLDEQRADADPPPRRPQHWTCPSCARQSCAKYAYRSDPPRFVRVCRFCGYVG